MATSNTGKGTRSLTVYTIILHPFPFLSTDAALLHSDVLGRLTAGSVLQDWSGSCTSEVHDVLLGHVLPILALQGEVGLWGQERREGGRRGEVVLKVSVAADL